jgi:hypothetical protein
MALIAPSKISPKGDYLYLEAFTTSGPQARTINQPIIWPKSLEQLRSIPFQYGIDNRYFDVKHVAIKEIALKYMKHIKSSFVTRQQEKLTTYQTSMFDVAVESVTLKVQCGADEQSEGEEEKFGFGVTLPLSWDDFKVILPDLWAGCVDEWDRQLKTEYQAIQLDLMDQLKDKGLALLESAEHVEINITHQDGEPIDIAAYTYPMDQLQGKRGLLTGSALAARQLKLIRQGIAKPIQENANHDDDSRPFGFDPSA